MAYKNNKNEQTMKCLVLLESCDSLAYAKKS